MYNIETPFIKCVRITLVVLKFYLKQKFFCILLPICPYNGTRLMYRLTVISSIIIFLRTTETSSLAVQVQVLYIIWLNVSMAIAMYTDEELL